MSNLRCICGKTAEVFLWGIGKSDMGVPNGAYAYAGRCRHHIRDQYTAPEYMERYSFEDLWEVIEDEEEFIERERIARSKLKVTYTNNWNRK